MSTHANGGVPQDEMAMAALERWLVREVVQRDLDTSLRSVDAMKLAMDNDATIAGCLFKLLRTFPLFATDAGVDAALREVFLALPSIDASMRARASPGLKTYLGPLLSSQILSAARARRQGVAAPTTSSVEYAARALVEISQDPTGLESFLEELKCAHSFPELRPSVRLWADAVHEEVSKFLAELPSNPNAFSKLKSMMSRIPKEALLIMLRMHMAGKASSIALNLALMRMNGSSMLQRLVSDALGYSMAKEEVESLRNSLSPSVAIALEEFAKKEYSGWMEKLASTFADDSGNPLSGQDAVAASKRCIHDYVLLASGGVDDLDEPTSWRALRYVELMSSKESTEEIVELLGEPALVNAISRLLSAAHSQLALSVFTKGSQMSKLAEEAFACIESALDQSMMDNANKEGRDNNAEQQRNSDRMRKAVERVLDRLVGVSHNILVADRSQIMHRTIGWAFHFYQVASRIQLPTNALFDGIQNEKDRAVVMEEARRVLQREEKAVGFGRTKVPRPKLLACERLLLKDMSESIMRELGTLIRAGEASRPGTSTAGKSAARTNGIRNLEVVPEHFEEKCWAELSARRFILCGRTRSASIWVRYGADMPASIKADVRPIIQIMFSDSERTLSQEGKWTLIPRNLNKGMLGRSKTFLWYRRAADDFESASFAITGLEVIASDADQRKRDALTQCGYRTVANLDTGLFGSVEVWVQGGVVVDTLDTSTATS